ncbi:MAG: PqiC family protein [Pseudomonadota bacterium]
MTLSRLLWTLTFCALLTACGSSPPNDYYILTAQRSPPPTGSEPALGVGPITVPEYLDTAQMIYDRQGNTVSLSSIDRWAEPLSDGMERVLALNLAALLNTQQVQTFPWHPKRTPDMAVKMNVLDLDSSAAGATLIAEWLLYRPGDSSVVRRRIDTLTTPLGATVAADVAAAYSTLLQELAGIIADEVNRSARTTRQAN